LQKAASLNHGPELPSLLGAIGQACFDAGFPAKSKYYYQEELKLDDDSAIYYSNLGGDQYWLENYAKSIEFGLKGLSADSNNYVILNLLGSNYAMLAQYDKSYKYFRKWLEKLKSRGADSPNQWHRIGYVYWKNGFKEEAQHFFDQQIEYNNRMNELKRPWGQSLYTYYDLAGVYAFRGEKDKAYKNLETFNQIQRIPFWMATLIKNDPLFKSISNEPEFQQIVRDIEGKYQAEHERVRKWLDGQGML
jgi:tetratricopeptide (TPR) repeat protein